MITGARLVSDLAKKMVRSGYAERASLQGIGWRLTEEDSPRVLVASNVCHSCVGTCIHLYTHETKENLARQ